MAKKVTENHKIVSGEEENTFEFEDLVEGLNTNEETDSMDTENNLEETKEAVNPKSKGKSKGENIIILKKAATYSGCGLKFTKDVPTPVEDKSIFDKLISTGLFVNSNG